MQRYQVFNYKVFYGWVEAKSPQDAVTVAENNPDLLMLVEDKFAVKSGDKEVN